MVTRGLPSGSVSEGRSPWLDVDLAGVGVLEKLNRHLVEIDGPVGSLCTVFENRAISDEATPKTSVGCVKARDAIAEV